MCLSHVVNIVIITYICYIYRVEVILFLILELFPALKHNYLKEKLDIRTSLQILKSRPSWTKYFGPEVIFYAFVVYLGLLSNFASLHFSQHY